MSSIATYERFLVKMNSNTDFKKLLAEYVSCKSVSSDDRMLSGMKDAREFLLEFFNKISIPAKEIGFGGHEIVFAQTEQHHDLPTVLIYGHYDVQPANDEGMWDSDPFSLVEKNGRLYARGASDNKGCNLTMLLAVRDIIEKNKKLPVNLKFVLEGEEEIGSVSIPKFLNTMKDELYADFALISDTWTFSENTMVITSGLRGLVGCEIELQGQDQDLHSGYGGCILNPIQALADMCSKLHDKDGYVAIDGFYDDVREPYDVERQQMKELPMSDDDLKKSLGIKFFKLPNKKFSAAETMRFLPTLEFNGITGGFQGNGIKTIIPCKASAKITCRLVNDQNSENIKNLLMKKLKELCPKEMSMSLKFEQSCNPYFLDIENIKNDVLSRAINTANSGIEKVFGKRPIYLRDGGSIGLVTMLKEILGIDSLLIGLTTSEDNIHGINESISIEMVERGRKFFSWFLSNL